MSLLPIQNVAAVVITLSGDTALAAEYVGIGKHFLSLVASEASFNNITTLARSKRIDDAIIRCVLRTSAQGIKHGSIFIYATKCEEKKKEEVEFPKIKAWIKVTMFGLRGDENNPDPDDPEYVAPLHPGIEIKKKCFIYEITSRQVVPEVGIVDWDDPIVAKWEEKHTIVETQPMYDVRWCGATDYYTYDLTGHELSKYQEALNNWFQNMIDTATADPPPHKKLPWGVIYPPDELDDMLADRSYPGRTFSFVENRTESKLAVTYTPDESGSGLDLLDCLTVEDKAPEVSLDYYLFATQAIDGWGATHALDHNYEEQADIYYWVFQPAQATEPWSFYYKENSIKKICQCWMGAGLQMGDLPPINLRLDNINDYVDPATGEAIYTSYQVDYSQEEYYIDKFSYLDYTEQELDEYWQIADESAIRYTITSPVGKMGEYLLAGAQGYLDAKSLYPAPLYGLFYSLTKETLASYVEGHTARYCDRIVSQLFTCQMRKEVNSGTGHWDNRDGIDPWWSAPVSWTYYDNFQWIVPGSDHFEYAIPDGLPVYYTPGNYPQTLQAAVTESHELGMCACGAVDVYADASKVDPRTQVEDPSLSLAIRELWVAIYDKDYMEDPPPIDGYYPTRDIRMKYCPLYGIEVTHYEVEEE